MDRQALTASQPALAEVPQQLRTAARFLEVDAGEVLRRNGSRVQNMYSVISGELRLVRRDRNGTEIILQRTRSGFIAESSLNSKAYHCDLVVAEGGVVLQFPVLAFRAALDQDSAFRAGWMEHLAREVRRLRAQCERMNLRSAPDRIIHFIESEGNDGAIVLNQTRKAWAAELGLTHEALYRTLTKLQSEGVLAVDGKRISLARAAAEE